MVHSSLAINNKAETIVLACKHMAEDTQAAQAPAIPAETKEQAAAADKEFQEAMSVMFATLGMKPVIERNKKEEPLHVFKILKGPNKNKRFLGPQLTVETLNEGIQWWGPAFVVDVLNTNLRRAAQEEWLNSIDKTTGVLNLAGFLSEMKEFTSAALKLSEIDDKIDELQELSRVLLEDPNADLGKNPDGSPKPDLVKMISYKDSIRSYKEMRDKKSGKGKQDAQPSVQVS